MQCRAKIKFHIKSFTYTLKNKGAPSESTFILECKDQAAQSADLFFCLNGGIYFTRDAIFGVINTSSQH